MSLHRRVLPLIPKGVPVTVLANNLKLFSEMEIANLKKHLTQNGRYRSFKDDAGSLHILKYPVFVFNGRYFASYPGKLFLFGETSIGKIKAAQDLDSGEWVPEKVIQVRDADESLLTHAAVNQEMDVLKKTQQVVLSHNEEAINFYRPGTPELPPVKDLPTQEQFFGGDMDVMPDYFVEPPHPSDDSGKYYLFMRRVSGMNLKDWLQHKPMLPVVIKLDISISLIEAIMRVHENKMLHRNIRPANVVFDMFKTVHQAVTAVNFGWDEPKAEVGVNIFSAPETVKSASPTPPRFSVESDIYALGVTLGVLWEQSRQYSNFQKMMELTAAMTRVEVGRRPKLAEVREALLDMKRRLNDADREVKICILDIDDFQDASESGASAFSQYLDELAAYDQIRLFDGNADTDEKLLIAIRQKLEEHHLIVASQVYVGDHADMRAFIAAHHQELAEDGRVYTMKFMTQYVDFGDFVMLENAASADDVRIAMDDGSSSDEGDDPGDFIPPEQPDHELYDLGRCVSWFFTSLAEDIDRLICQRRGSDCIRFFTREPARPAPPNSNNPDPNNSDEEREQINNIV